ncbi:MAG: elongation factor P [Robiginitomaculum sp.]|nr:elongation factor P [Robiginitomaculum sp.]
MKINGNEIRPGHVLEHQNSLWLAVKCQAVKPGKGGAFNQVEMKNLINGSKLNERFRSSEKVEKIRLEQKPHTYLYDNGDTLAFMDSATFEQIELMKEFIGDAAAYLQDGMQISIEFHEERAISVSLPEQVTLQVVETEPVVKGQTAANSFKPAILDNGVRTSIPPFVGVDEKVVISTSDGSYVKRAE